MFGKKKSILVEKPAVMNLGEIHEVKKKLNGGCQFFEGFMYLFHPQIKKTKELIKQEEIGELISMESYFGNNVMTKKNWLGFTKKKKIDPNNRIFNKKMGGGSILDLGCYPVSFSSKIASLKNSTDTKNISFSNKKVILGSTGVDVDAHLTLNFDNSFISKIGSSFSRDLGRKTIIEGSKGKIIIEDTWTAKPSRVVLQKNNDEIVFNIQSNENIYTYEIAFLSNFILRQKKESDLITHINDTIFNMQIIDHWKN